MPQEERKEEKRREEKRGEQCTALSDAKKSSIHKRSPSNCHHKGARRASQRRSIILTLAAGKASATLLWHGGVDPRNVQLDTPFVVRGFPETWTSKRRDGTKTDSERRYEVQSSIA
jgi:hypothetical protein